MHKFGLSNVVASFKFLSYIAQASKELQTHLFIYTLQSEDIF